MRRLRSSIVFVMLAACTSDESTPSSGKSDASVDAAPADGGSVDSGPITPASDGGCDGSVPGMSAGSESLCAGKHGQPVPGVTDASAPGTACNAAEDCQPFCCTCGDGGAFVSSVAVCGCGNVCATATETCALYEKTFALCK